MAEIDRRRYRGRGSRILAGINIWTEIDGERARLAETDRKKTWRRLIETDRGPTESDRQWYVGWDGQALDDSDMWAMAHRDLKRLGGSVWSPRRTNQASQHLTDSSIGAETDGHRERAIWTETD